MEGAQFYVHVLLRCDPLRASCRICHTFVQLSRNDAKNHSTGMRYFVNKLCLDPFPLFDNKVPFSSRPVTFREGMHRFCIKVYKIRMLTGHVLSFLFNLPCLLIFIGRTN